MKLLRSVRNITAGRGVFPFLGVLFVALSTACEPIFDDLSDCFGGIRLRFVYEYHMMRGANAFPGYVDCIDVYVFDEEGRYVTCLTETSEALRDENYRIDLSLEPGTYEIVAYGGSACDSRRFTLTPDWKENLAAAEEYFRPHMTVRVADYDPVTGVSRRQLHDINDRTGGLFYGGLFPGGDFTVEPLRLTVTEEDLKRRGYREETVYMMNDVNSIQVVLEELAYPYQVDWRDYDVRILDDNFVLDHENMIVPVTVTDEEENVIFRPVYEPYNGGANMTMGFMDYVERDGAYLEEDEERPVQVAVYEFSTSRLMTLHMDSARLVVSERATGKELIDLPLVKYLTALYTQGTSWIKSSQEFLDRQSDWHLMLFLQDGKWNTVNVKIAVNNWVVRLNEAQW